MRLSSCFRAPAVLLAVAAALLVSNAAVGQFRGVQAASVMPPTSTRLTAGEEVSIPLKVVIRPGYHINSNTPAESYLIPTRLTWSDSGLKVKAVEYPEAEVVNYEFSEKPLSVFSGSITVLTTLAVPDPIPAGLTELSGKLRYQACNEKACLPPVTADVKVPVTSH